MKQDTARRTILMVEDEPLMRLVGSLFLNQAGYSVLVASNAEQALRILDSGVTVEVLFTDIEMPGALDGKGLARAVHERWPEIRIVMASGCPEHAKEARRLGAFFIAKPYAPDKLSSLIGTEAEALITA